MDYIGSKKKWKEEILRIINKGTKNRHNHTFIDGCTGSGEIALEAMKNNYKVIINDNMFFPSIIVSGRIVSRKKIASIENHIDVINNLTPIKGYFHKNYWKQNRKYFTEENCKRIDATQEYLRTIKDKEIKNTLTFFSIEALSRISNTTGVHGAFLKKFKKRALDTFQLRFEEDKIIISNDKIIAQHKDITELIKLIKPNNKTIIYIDPPYNGRQYGPNYHLYETFVKDDEPILKGKTGLRNDWINECKSDMCNVSGFMQTITNIIKMANGAKIFLSYNTDGLLSIQQFKKLFDDLGVKHKIHSWETLRYKSDVSENREYNNTNLKEILIEIS